MPSLTETQKCILLVVGLSALAVIWQLGSTAYMRVKSDDKMTSLQLADSVWDQTSTLLIVDSTANLKCLKNQYNAAHYIKGYYLGVAKTFYTNYYAFAICSVLFGTVLAIATFLVIGSGWQNASLLAKTFFLTTTFISSLYFFLPTVLNNKENYIDNLAKAKIFQHIELNVLDYSTKRYAAQPDSLSQTLSKIFSDIANNYDLQTIGISAEKMGGNPEDLLKSARPTK